MRKITDIISKPSEALRAMVDGLIEQSKREDFKIDMMSFGGVNKTKGICFGCAATCAIQKLAGINFTAESGYINDLYTRAYFLGFTKYELDEFENIINDARCGLLDTLFSFFGFNQYEYKRGWENTYYLHGDDWEEQIPKVEIIIKKMQKEGY